MYLKHAIVIDHDMGSRGINICILLTLAVPFLCYGDPCTGTTMVKTMSGQTWRSVSYNETNSTNSKCDATIDEGWYRVESEAGNDTVTECVPTYRCGTHFPIWMNGMIPDVSDGIVVREMCVSHHLGCCHHKFNIRMQNCGDYRVYELIQTAGCNWAYCLGDLVDSTTAANIVSDQGSGYSRYTDYKYLWMVFGVMAVVIIIVVLVLILLRHKFKALDDTYETPEHNNDNSGATGYESLGESHQPQNETDGTAPVNPTYDDIHESTFDQIQHENNDTSNVIEGTTNLTTPTYQNEQQPHTSYENQNFAVNTNNSVGYTNYPYDEVQFSSAQNMPIRTYENHNDLTYQHR